MSRWWSQLRRMPRWAWWLLLAAALWAAHELGAQWLVGRPEMAQLLSPNGSLGVLALVAATLLLRLAVFVVVPSWLVATLVLVLLRRLAPPPQADR